MDDFSSITTLVGGLKGAGTLATVAVVVQILMLVIKSDSFSKYVPNLSGALKLTIVSGLTLVGTVVAQMSVSGSSIGSALTQGVVLSALAVFGNQLVQQFTAKSDVTVAAK